MDLHPTAGQPGALAHPGEAVAAARRRRVPIGRGEPAAVVGDPHDGPAAILPDLDGHARRPGVALDVGQRLLHDAVDDRLLVVVEPGEPADAEVERDVHAGRLLEAVGLRAAISIFYAIGTGTGGFIAPVLFGWLIESGNRGSVALGYAVGAALALVAGGLARSHAVDAERKALEEVASLS